MLQGEKFGMDADNLALPITSTSKLILLRTRGVCTEMIFILVIGCATGLAALAALTLPETKDRKLPETLQDIKNLPYGFACCQKESRVSWPKEFRGITLHIIYWWAYDDLSVNEPAAQQAEEE